MAIKQMCIAYSNNIKSTESSFSALILLFVDSKDIGLYKFLLQQLSKFTYDRST